MIIFLLAFNFISPKFSQHSICGLILLLIRKNIGMVDIEKFINYLTSFHIYYTYSFILSHVHTFPEDFE
jgi:hypothetical protein